MELSGAQFGNYAMTRTTPDDPARDSMEYAVYRQHPDEHGISYDPASYVGGATVTPHPAKSWTNFPVEHNEEWHAAAAYHGRSEAPLFDHGSTAPSTSMELLTLTKADRHMAPTVVGLAARDAALAGRPLTASDDLSRHSHRMLGHLEKAGVQEAAHEFHGDNGLDFRAPTPVGYRGGLEGLHEYVRTHQDTINGEQFVPKSEVRAGQRAMRSLLPRRPRPEPEQGRLF